MIRIIPREKVQHLEWNPNNPSPPPNPQPPQPPQTGMPISIDRIVSGTTFYSDKKDGSKWIGLPIALEEALTFATPNGILATMPELMAAKLQVAKNHDFWTKWYTVHTEENIGIDKKGRHYTKDEPVYVLINGGGILTPARIRQAYTEGLINNSAKYRQEEFDAILEGKTADGATIPMYKLEDIKSGVSNLPHRFGVVMPYAVAQAAKSEYLTKKEFVENPLGIARAGDWDLLGKYFDKAKGSDNKVGIWHPFSGRDPTTPQGRVLFLGYGGDGLNGCDLGYSGRFVGVAPEAHGAKK